MSKETIGYLRWLTRYDFQFLSMIRSRSTGRFAKNPDKSEMELVYEKNITKNKETRIYGKATCAEV